MCGIVGYSGPFSPDLLACANRRQSHRGPDDSGEFVDKDAGVGLGHVRLSILDLSPLGHQPMADDAQSAVIVFNGEIYNFKELREDLEGRGHRFRGSSDTEVLLYLYIEHGERMVRFLNGIFAFAIFDRKRRDLFLARDALGVKPLYYTDVGSGFAFASEIKSLMCLVPEARELDIPSLHRYLTFQWCPGEGTPLKGVRKLGPGEAMVVREGAITRRWRWYDLPIGVEGNGSLSESSYVTGTAGQLREAVHRQLVSDVPVGAFLSGGLDSSAVVAFAKERLPEIRCFTIEIEAGDDEGTAYDLPYAKRVAKHLNVPLEVVRIDAGRMAGDLERMVAQLDEPLGDPAPLNVLYICSLARQHDVKVLLSGAGGDDIFTGYRRHLAVSYERLWRWLPRPVRLSLDRGSANLDQRRPLFRRLAKLFRGAGLDGDQRLANYFAWARESELLALYTSEFRIGLQGTTAMSPMLDFLNRAPASSSDLERLLSLDQRFFLADHNLIYVDKMSMATGVEVRVPFLDLELVDYASRIPIGLKQRGSVGKWILKRAMEPYLPKDVIYRPKTGFGAPLRRWMRHDLRTIVGDILSPECLARRGLFDPEAVQRLIVQNERGNVDGAYTLFSLLTIEIWCRAFLDGAPADRPA